jgi:hypothetical protein
MPSPKDADPRYWGGLKLPVEKVFVTESDIDAITEKIGLSTKGKLRATMPNEDGTHSIQIVTVRAFLFNRLNRAGRMYALDVSQSKQPTPLKTKKNISASKGHVDSLLKSLGLPIERPRDVSSDLLPPSQFDTLYPFARDLAATIDTVSIKSSPAPGRTLLSETLDSIYSLATILRQVEASLQDEGNARYAPNPINVLIGRLQGIYEEAFKKKATDVVNPATKKAEGPWYKFASWACTQVGAPLDPGKVRGRWRELRKSDTDTH